MTFYESIKNKFLLIGAGIRAGSLKPGGGNMKLFVSRPLRLLLIWCPSRKAMSSAGQPSSYLNSFEEVCYENRG